MPAFLCVMPVGGRALGAEARERAMRRAAAGARGVWRWTVEPASGAVFGVAVDRATARTSVPAVVSVPGGMLVGSARLDDSVDGGPEDLVRIAAVVRERGADAVRGLLGDFAFVYFEPGSRRVVAARDAFGVRTLYRREGIDAVAWASSASVLLDSETYDPEYAAEFLLNGYDPSDRTPYREVGAVPAGAVATVAAGVVLVRRDWCVSGFPPGG